MSGVDHAITLNRGRPPNYGTQELDYHPFKSKKLVW